MRQWTVLGAAIRAVVLAAVVCYFIWLLTETIRLHLGVGSRSLLETFTGG